MWEGNQKENYYVFMSRQPYFPSKPAPYSAQPVLLLIVPLFSMALKLYCDIFRVSRDTSIYMDILKSPQEHNLLMYFMLYDKTSSKRQMFLDLILLKTH